MNQPREITTPNGYKATIKDFLTYGESKQIKRVMLDAIKIKLSTNLKAGENIDEEKLAKEASQQMEMNEISGSVMERAKDLAASFLIVKIIDPQGKDLGAGVQALDQIPEEDGEYIQNEIDNIRKGSDLTKKNGTQ